MALDLEEGFAYKLSRGTQVLGTSLAVLGIVVAFLAGMYLIHPAAATTIRTITNAQSDTATTTSTIFVSSTGTVDIIRTVNKTETIVSTITDAVTATSTSSSSYSSSCSQSVSLPSGSYTNTENVHLSISACSKAVILVGPSNNPDEYTITCNGSCFVVLENMLVNTYYVSVSINGNMYTSQFEVTSTMH